MKKTLLSYILFFYCYSLSAQSQWEQYTIIADSLEDQLSFKQALSFRTKALESAKHNSENTRKKLLGLQMFTQAEVDFAINKKENPEAYQLMQDAVTTLQKAKADPERISKAYWNLNLAAFNYMRNQEDTEKFLNKSIEYHLKSSQIDTLLLLNTMHGSGYMATLSNNYEKAITTLEKAITLFKQYKNKKEQDDNLLGYLYTDLALIYSLNFLDIPLKERMYLQEAESVFSANTKPDLEYFIGVYTSLANNNRRYRNYKSAENYLNKALQIYEKNKKELHSNTMHHIGFKTELTLLGDLIIIYRDTGAKHKMLELFNKIEQIAKSNPFDQTEKNQFSEIIRSVGRYYLNQEFDFKKATYYLNKALEINTKKTVIHSGGITTSLYLDLAKAHFLKGSFSDALKIVETIERSQELESYQTELKVKCLLELNKSGLAMDAINQLVTAISIKNISFNFLQSPPTDFKPGYVITAAEGFVDLAKAFHRYYETYSAEEEKLYWMALIQFEKNIGNTPLNKDLKKTFDEITHGLMHFARQREFTLEEHNRLLNFMETVASQELINSFLLKRKIAGSTQLYKLVEEEQYVRSYLTHLKKEFLKDQNDTLKQQIFEREIKLRKINEQLIKEHRLSGLIQNNAIDINALPKKNIIKFKVFDDELFKIQITNGKIDYEVIENFRALRLEIEQYLILINNVTTPITIIKQRGGVLYKKLFKNSLNFDDSTVIIVDDILHYLPFEVLVHDDRYLIEDNIISYVPNFYFLNTTYTESPPIKNKKAVFFAPKYSEITATSQLIVRGEPYSLKGAEEEVREISKFISGKKYLGEKASKSNFKNVEKDLSILHLAMHSNLNEEDPELSNLLFSSSEQDSELYISELYGLNFNADLAVLSACNTGIGGFKDGGNIVSMRQAFNTAGVSATIASLWNAPDQSTKEIMVSFYRNLSEGENKATALQKAKLNYLAATKDENFKHPFYWAGFVLSGEETPIDLQKKSFWKTSLGFSIIILGLIFFILMIFLLRKILIKENIK